MSAHAPVGISGPKDPQKKPVTLRTLAQMKREGAKITMVTAYDVTFARLLDAAGVDMLLVGDSLGMVVKGEPNTLSVSIEQMAYHVAAVARGVSRSHVVGDMPFMSYQASPEQAMQNAALLLRAGASSVKLEGGESIAPTVARMVEAGIPVMGHVGLQPQSVHAMGGFVVQGRDPGSRRRILDDALALERAGAYAIVLEGIPADLAAEITAQLSIPTIGIGAGPACDGQVLVIYDLLGMNPDFSPKFVKKFLDGAKVMGEAFQAYVAEVKGGAFPAQEHTFGTVASPAAPKGPEAKPVEKASIPEKDGVTSAARAHGREEAP
jgi:3-methyl-2-oxobutanoate hydroxymethyltransferase